MWPYVLSHGAPAKKKNANQDVNAAVIEETALRATGCIPFVVISFARNPHTPQNVTQETARMSHNAIGRYQYQLSGEQSSRLQGRFPPSGLKPMACSLSVLSLCLYFRNFNPRVIKTRTTTNIVDMR